MNGPQDIGGRHGFGAVALEDESVRFHADWEKRVLGLTIAASALGYWTIDAMRHARESISPAVYYGSSYYGIWLYALETMLERSGKISQDEMSDGRAARHGSRGDRRLQAASVGEMLASGSPSERPGPNPLFNVGDRIRTKNHQPSGHTRLPGYARNQPGIIVAMHGNHVYPDTNARGAGENATPLYTVGFRALDLFGRDADPTLTIMIEAWEPYLEPT